MVAIMSRHMKVIRSLMLCAAVICLRGGSIIAFDIDAPGSLKNSRPFGRLAGGPVDTPNGWQLALWELGVVYSSTM